MDIAQIMTGTEPSPATLEGLLLWLLTAGGLSTAVTAVTALVISGVQWILAHDLTDRQKLVVAVLVPFALVGLADAGLAIFFGHQWTLEGTYQHVKLAILVLLGGQTIFHAVYKPFVKDALEGVLARAKQALAGG